MIQEQQQIQLFDQVAASRRRMNAGLFSGEQRRPLLLQSIQIEEPILSESTLSDEAILNELTMMVGVQPVNDLRTPITLAFVMRTKEADEGYGMSIVLEPHTTELSKHRATLHEWKNRIAQRLLEKSAQDLLMDDVEGGFLAIFQQLSEPDVHKRRLLFDGLDLSKSENLLRAYERALPYNLQRKMSKIAKACRRGMGNVLVGSRDMVEWAQKFMSPYQREKMRFVIYENGEVQDLPWLLVGYCGKNRYDAGLVFTHQKGGRGALVENNVERYWRRLL